MLPIQVLLLAALTACFLPAGALVDESSPDLSGFKLRHVNVKDAAHKRVQQAITSLSEGAISMRESLFVEANNVKCPAYAHLFKLIKLANNAKLAQPVKQNLVQALAVVATYDRVFYHKLFLQSLQASTASFLEALLDLEANPSSEAQRSFLDLIGCLSEYMSNGVVAEFLNTPRRAAALASIEKFQAIPVDEERAPVGLVSGLVNKFQSQQDVNVDQSLFPEADKLVREFDDEQTASARIQIQSQGQGGAGADANDDFSGQQIIEPSEEEMKHIKLPADIELPVPVEDDHVAANDAQPKQTFNGKPFTLDQLASLKFIKMRLESKQRDAPKLSMRLAFDFNSHWEDLLNSSGLDSGDEVGAASIGFRDDPQNAALAERVRKVIDDYVNVVGVLAEIETLGEKYDSIDELRIPLERLNSLLSTIDKKFDLNDVRRLQTIWKLKFTEYNTMQRFLDDNLHW